jgi:uncharacterized protein (DUF305 family)
MDTMTVQRRKQLIAAVLVAAVAAGGIAWAVTSPGSQPERQPAAKSTRSPVPVIVPGKPGAAASVVPSDQITAPDGSRYNSLDVWFVRMMIEHHQQAIEMAELAPSRARRPQINAIAERIRIAQGPEIGVLRAWLKSRRLSESPDQGSKHDHGAMRGMVSPQSMRALTGTSGDAFDRLFVDLMSTHHEGAIDMCSDVLDVSADERIQELATNIAAEQEIEISRMRQLLN